MMTQPHENAAEIRRRSLLGLNGLNFFVADMLTGFGPFVTVYLTENGWKATDIGIVLSIGTLAAVAGQVPAGILVDSVPHKRIIASDGVLAVIVAALVLGTFSNWWPVAGAELVQGVSASLLTPAIASITLTLSKHDKLGERLGGNVRFKALGSILAALLMGFVGSRVGPGAVFFVSAVFGGLALGCVWTISGVDIETAPERTEHPTAWPKRARKEPLRRKRELWREPRLLTFAGCVFMFQLSNAAVLPFAISAVQQTAGHNTDFLVALALIVSQTVAAAISPMVGRSAHRRGRRMVLLAGFGALALRCTLLALYADQITLVCYQVLDGLSAATVGVMVPLVVADITHRGGRFNLAMGLVGLAMTAGASLSTTVAGFLTDKFGTSVAFLWLAAAAAAGCVLIWWVLPETGQSTREGQRQAGAPQPA